MTMHYKGPVPALARSDYEARLASLDRRITLPYPDWTLMFREYGTGPDGSPLWIIQIVVHEGTDNTTGAKIEWRTRKWLLSQHMTDGEIIQTVLKAVLTAVEHEVRETLLFDGVPIFDPHYDIHALRDFRAAGNLGVRPPLPRPPDSHGEEQFIGEPV